jgi:hypothetical protein
VVIGVQAKAQSKVNIEQACVGYITFLKIFLIIIFTVTMSKKYSNIRIFFGVILIVCLPFILIGQGDSTEYPKYNFEKYERTISDEELHARYYDTLGYGNYAELAAQENIFEFYRFHWYKIFIKSISERQIDIERGIDWDVFKDITHSCYFSILDSAGKYIVPYYRVVFNPRKQVKLGKAVDKYFALYEKVENASENGIKYESKEYQQLKTKLQAAEKLVKRYMANYRLPIRKWNTVL